MGAALGVRLQRQRPQSARCAFELKHIYNSSFHYNIRVTFRVAREVSAWIVMLIESINMARLPLVEVLFFTVLSSLIVYHLQFTYS